MNNINVNDNSTEEMLIKEANNRNIVINKDINSETIYKAMYWLKKIKSIDDKNNIPTSNRQPINIFINSYGGEVYEGLALISLIKSMQKEGYIINTYSESKSMSMGFVIFCVGTNRYISKYSTLMYHSVSSMTCGKTQEMIEDINENIRLDNVIKDIVIEHTKISKETLDDVTKCKKDWYINSKEALDLGIATEII